MAFPLPPSVLAAFVLPFPNMKVRLYENALACKVSFLFFLSLRHLMRRYLPMPRCTNDEERLMRKNDGKLLPTADRISFKEILLEAFFILFGKEMKISPIDFIINSNIYGRITCDCIMCSPVLYLPTPKLGR